jgi:hypothetical protein
MESVRKLSTAVKNNTSGRRYTIKMDSDELAEFSEKHRRWHDDDFRESDYPIMHNGIVLFEEPKKRSTTWVFKLKLRIVENDDEGERQWADVGYEIIAPNQYVAAYFALQSYFEKVWIGEYNLGVAYYAYDIVKEQHGRVSNSRNNDI